MEEVPTERRPVAVKIVVKYAHAIKTAAHVDSVHVVMKLGEYRLLERFMHNYAKSLAGFMYIVSRLWD